VEPGGKARNYFKYYECPLFPFFFLSAAGTAGTYHLTVTAANGALPNAVQNFTLTVEPVQAVLLRVRVQGGQQERSLITFLDVIYSDPVTFRPGAFRLRRAGGGVIRLRPQLLTVNDQTVVRLSFVTDNLDRSALGDSRYRLTVDGTKVLDAKGQPVDGGGPVRFFRLYGDTNGNGRLGPVDLGRLQQVLSHEGDWQRWAPRFRPVTVGDLLQLVGWLLLAGS
jgi:hypothetical protein